MGFFDQNPGSPGFAATADEATTVRRQRNVERALTEMYADGTLRALIDSLPSTITTLLASGITTTTIAASSNVSVGGTLNTTGAAYFPEALSNPVTSGYFAAYINGDNRLGRTISARRYKQDIQAWKPGAQAIFGMQLVTYRLKTAVEELGDDAPVEVGLIAEELVELGLGWLVQYVDGQVEGIAYEKIALAMLPTLQDHERRLSALEGKPVPEPSKDFNDHEYDLDPKAGSEQQPD